MHSDEERAAILTKTLNIARAIATHPPAGETGKAAWEYLQFCVRHGYYGFPTKKHGIISACKYLQPGRIGHPTSKEEIERSLGIIPCFSDELPPGDPTNTTTQDGVRIITSAYVYWASKLLVLGYIDWYTPVELAFKLLHEARHARDHFGLTFENLPPLDPEEHHESRTWEYELTLIDASAGEAWKNVVQQEATLLYAKLVVKGLSPGDKYYTSSGQTYPELDSFFGTPVTRYGEAERQILVAMRALFLLAEQANLPNMERAYTNIVGAFYEWSKREAERAKEGK